MQVLSRRESIDKARSENKKIALVFPIYYPSALLRAFDIHPIEIWGADDVDLSLADMHIQSYTCSLGRILLAFVKDHRFRKDYDLVFVPHICDTFQQIGSLLIDFINIDKPIINFYMPKRSDELGISYCVSELKRIIGILENLTGNKFKMERLEQEIMIELKIDELMRKVYEKREYIPITDSEFYKLITAKTYLSALDFVETLNGILGMQVDKPREVLKKIFMSGIAAESAEIFDIINSYGAVVAFDDLAIAARRILNRSIQSTDALRRQSELILFTVPDAQKGSLVSDKIDWFKKEIGRTRVVGGIFYIMKFCEPEYFYYPQIRKHLLDMGVKTFIIEYELSRKMSRQNMVRVQSFLEGL
ncbi:MAG: 2-hydroxyacyl-CoA dehydratase family protein [Deltaproteobacteria bacterium]|nr:2-hydroxyacyl-CoA dehydratase family protein [Deltaproteobacteria bacterium]